MSTLSPIAIQGDASVEVRAESSTTETTNLEILVVSERFTMVNANLEYRIGNGMWQNDMRFSDTAVAGDGFALLGIPASSSGSSTQVQWNHGSNGMSLGDQVDLRATLSSPLMIHGWSGLVGIASEINPPRVINVLSKKVVGLSLDGDWLCFDVATNDFIVISPGGSTVGTLTGLTSSQWAQQKRDGRYLVLHNNSITEWDRDDGVIQNVALGAFATGATHFHYDDLTGNMLVSGGSMDQVAEITWGEVGAGTLIGTHVGLSNPRGVSYGGNRFTWYIADTGNNQVCVVDRANSLTANITSVTVDGEVLTLESPVLVKELSDGRIAIVESIGIPAVFSSDPETHPALKRANGTGAIALRNIIFAPLLRSSQ